MAEDSTSTLPRDKTPDKWDSPKDAREKGREYPNYWVRKTRSGHTFMLDDTKDNEQITLQHRSGTMIQLLPDGGFQIVSHKGRYDVTYGENRVKVTGAQDTTVDGDCSTKVKCNQNSTIYGNQISSIKGHSVTTAKSENKVIAEHSDTVTGTKTEQVNNNSTTQVLGAATMLSKKGMTLGSTGDSLAMGAKNQVGMKSGQQMAFKSGGKFSIKTDGGGEITIDGNKLYLNSNKADNAEDVVAQTSTPQSQNEQNYNTATVA